MNEETEFQQKKGSSKKVKILELKNMIKFLKNGYNKKLDRIEKKHKLHGVAKK